MKDNERQENTTAKAGLLGTVTDKAETFGLVFNDVGSDGWVMGDLLDQEGG